MTQPSLSREQALDLVRQLIDAASSRDITRLMALYADQAVVVSPVCGEARGRAEVAATWMTMFSTLAEIAVEVSDVWWTAIASRS